MCKDVRTAVLIKCYVNYHYFLDEFIFLRGLKIFDFFLLLLLLII